jgi:F0F1-type ATP synthase membrane subunit b/b'
LTGDLRMSDDRKKRILWNIIAVVVFFYFLYWLLVPEIRS